MSATLILDLVFDVKACYTGTNIFLNRFGNYNRSFEVLVGDIEVFKSPGWGEQAYLRIRCPYQQSEVGHVGPNWQSYRRAPSYRAIERHPSRPYLAARLLFQLQSIKPYCQTFA